MLDALGTANDKLSTAGTHTPKIFEPRNAFWDVSELPPRVLYFVDHTHPHDSDSNYE